MKKDKIFKSVKVLTIASLLTAMSVVIGIFCKSMLNFGDGLFRITFENLPIILSGILFGPIVGGLVGIASDLISYLLSPQVFPLKIIVTLGAGAIGVLSGVVSKYVIKKGGYLQIIASASVAHLIGSVIIKSIGLFSFYQWAVLFRLPTYLLIASVEVAIICLLYKKSSFRRLIEEARKENL